MILEVLFMKNIIIAGPSRAGKSTIDSSQYSCSTLNELNKDLNDNILDMAKILANVAKLVLLSLCETVCARLRADNNKAGVVAVSFCDFEFHYFSHQ